MARFRKCNPLTGRKSDVANHPLIPEILNRKVIGLMRRLTVTIAMCLPFVATGCSAIGSIFTATGERITSRNQLATQASAVRRSEREARAAERVAALENELARREQRVQHARRNEIDSLRSKLSFDLDQRFTVSEMQVDAPRLKQLMAKRDKDYKDIQEAWDKVEKEMENARNEAELQEARRNLDNLLALGEAKGCYAAKPLCEEDARRLPELPAKRPITPVEIPMVLRVRWRIGMDNARLEDARIRRLPTMPAQRPCQRCPPSCRECETYCEFEAECSCGAESCHQSGRAERPVPPAVPATRNETASFPSDDSSQAGRRRSHVRFEPTGETTAVRADVARRQTDNQTPTRY